MFPLLAIPPLVQAGIGLMQNLAGNKRAKNLVRPERTTPQAVQEAVASTKYGAQSANRPGSALARERIGGTQAATVSQVGKAGGSAAQQMAASLGAQQQANKSLQEQDVLNAQFQQQQQMQYLQALDQLSSEQAQNWQWNEAQNFMEEAAAARRQQEAGVQNIMGGLMTGTQLGAMGQMGYFGNNKAQAGIPPMQFNNPASNGINYQIPSFLSQQQPSNFMQTMPLNIQAFQQKYGYLNAMPGVTVGN